MTSIDTPTAVTDRLNHQHGAAITIGDDCDLPDDLVVEIDDDAHLTLGNRVAIRRGTTIQVHRGATIAIGDDVAIGENCFLSAMAGISLGSGSALSNMVDIHDHNHNERSAVRVPSGDLLPWASGFSAAPIVIEPGVIISNKVSITAGVRVGHNTIVGANAVVTRSIAPDTIAAGVPATPRRHFAGAPAPTIDQRRTLTVGWFGTSIMEHLEAFNARMANQADLPPVGSTVTVEDWRRRGYVHRLHLWLQAVWPHLGFAVDNRGAGGATSRDIAEIVRAAAAERSYDVTFLGCGVNDVWRGFQGRTAEAVDRAEFTEHYTTMLESLGACSRTVICISETPFGPIEDPHTVAEMNLELARYNDIAAQAAARAGALFLDVWGAFAAAARQLASIPPETATGSLWSDGVHLSELGDALMQHQVATFLTEHRIIEDLIDYPQLERDLAIDHYRPLFAAHRPA